MNKKIFLLLGAMVVISGAVLGAAGTISYDVSKAVDVNAPAEYITLNNTNRPTIVDGNATNQLSEYTTVEYVNVADYAAGHVELLEGGYIQKVDSANTLDSITATFTGSLKVFSSYEAGRVNYEYILTSGIAQSLKGNYFKVVALEDTQIDKLNVSYGCEEASKVLMYNGQDFFSGDNWYTATSGNMTEDGTQIGSAIEDNGTLRFHRQGTGDETPDNIGHIALFQASDHLSVYNTNATGGIYNPTNSYLNEFNMMSGVRYTYEFDMLFKHSFTMMIGGAVKARLGNGTIKTDSSTSGQTLATYININFPNKYAKLTQGGTQAASRTLSEGIVSPNNSFTLSNANANKIQLVFIRENTDTSSGTKDKLILQLYVNGKHVVFVDDGVDGTNSTNCTVNENGDYVFLRRLWDNTQYGPYFGIYPNNPTKPTEDNDVIISSMNWYRDEKATGSMYQSLKATTYVDSGSGNQTKNFSDREYVRACRPSSGVIRDAHLKWDASNIVNLINEQEESERSAFESSLRVTFRFKSTSLITTWNSSIKLQIGYIKLGSYLSDVDWDETAQTWTNRTDGIKWANMQQSVISDYIYDTKTGLLEVSFNYTTIKPYIDLENVDVGGENEHLATNLFTLYISSNDRTNFSLEFHSVNATNAMDRPMMYFTFK